MTELRRLGSTDLFVSPIAMGCWPIAGITTIDVTEADAVATIEAAFESGINFFDTANNYGYDGESEKLVGRVLGPHRDKVVIATKGGLSWKDKVQVKDASPKRLREQCEESLRRLGMPFVDLLYLHAPDPKTPIRESAAALKKLMEEGKTKSVGLSNCTVAQLEEFSAECPLAAIQPPYNMLQRGIEADLIPWCRAHGTSIACYWPLMKGLLAGAMGRNHQFDPRDGRRKYPIYQGEEWRRNQDFVDRIRRVAESAGKSVAQVVLNWTINRPGIACALAGAKRPDQIRENAGAMGWRLSDEHLAELERAIEERGAVVHRSPV
jgi:aryl-alcohol dehydrogenase-like predicted oxidoreductase